MFRQGKPLLILDTGWMGADIAFYNIGSEGCSVEEFMTPQRPCFVLLRPVRAMVGGEFVEQLLAFVFRVQ